MHHIDAIVRAMELAGIPKYAAQNAAMALISYLTPKEQTAILIRMQSYKPV